MPATSFSLQLGVFVVLALAAIVVARRNVHQGLGLRVGPDGYSENPPGKITGVWSNGVETFELTYGSGPMLDDGEHIYMGTLVHNVLTFHCRTLLWDGHHALADTRTASIFTRNMVVPGRVNDIQGHWETGDGHHLAIQSQDLVTWGLLDGAPFVAIHDGNGARAMTRDNYYLMSYADDTVAPTLRLHSDDQIELVFVRTR